MTVVGGPFPVSRICLIVSFVLFLIASLLSFGVIHADSGVLEGLALLGFGFWVVAGAV